MLSIAPPLASMVPQHADGPRSHVSRAKWLTARQQRQLAAVAILQLQLRAPASAPLHDDISSRLSCEHQIERSFIRKLGDWSGSYVTAGTELRPLNSRRNNQEKLFIENGRFPIFTNTSSTVQKVFTAVVDFSEKATCREQIT